MSMEHADLGKPKGAIVTDEKGIVLIIVLIAIVALTLLAAAAHRNVVTDIAISSNHLGSIQAFQAADGGAQYGFNQLWQELQKLTPNPAGITPPTVSGYTFATASYVSTVGALVQRPATGTFAGLTAYVQRYRITSKATENNTNAVGTATYEVEGQLIPVFQFGIFYNNDLEIFPGANMTFNGGRIHTNSSIYLGESGGSTSLNINSPITAAGDLSRNRKDGGATDHNVYINNGAGSSPILDIDSTNASWATQSQTEWKGRVQTASQGITPLNLPLPDGGHPIDLLGTGGGTPYAMSGLRISNGAATNKTGATVELRYYDATYRDSHGNLIIDPGGTASLNVNPLTTGSIYDYREARTVTTYDLDMSKLQHSATAMSALNNPPSGGDPGIVYIASTDTTKGVRLLNGASLPATGLSVVSNDPVYVKGDYNTANNPAAIIADAVTVLSNAWSNSYTSGTGISSRAASQTTVNAAVMVGNKDTSGSDYSGGAENLIRFLENWSGVNFNYAGSLVCLWQSQQATHKWPGTGTIYNPPNRNWSYGIDASRLPPGTPRVRYVLKLGWRMVTN